MKKLFERLDLKNRLGPTRKDYIITAIVFAVILATPGGMLIFLLLIWLFGKR